MVAISPMVAIGPLHYDENTFFFKNIHDRFCFMTYAATFSCCIGTIVQEPIFIMKLWILENPYIYDVIASCTENENRKFVNFVNVSTSTFFGLVFFVLVHD